MKQSNRITGALIPAVALACGISCLSSIRAAVVMDWADVGDAGNTADNSTSYGAVAYDYQISKHEVTISQYAEFLNAVAATDTHGLYNANMGTNPNIAGISRTGSSGSYSYAVVNSGDRPITYVSWFDSARFVNWMENGQGAGDTETGVYDMSLAGVLAVAAPGASFRLPTEDEWYKAAYYDPTKAEADDGDNYWLHATQSDTLTDNSTSANYYDGDYATTQSASYSSSQNYLTDVGSYTGQESHYGTFDQGGNVWEWNDAVIGSSRGLRGGSWGSRREGFLRSSGRALGGPTSETNDLGFRIARAAPAAVPEPSSIALLLLGSISLLLRRNRG